MRLILFTFFAFALQSCQSQNMDSVIDKFDREDFSELSGMSLYFRSNGGPMSTIYFVNQYKGTCSPYIVEVKNDDHSVIAIKNDLVLKSCGKDYLQREEIERAIKKYISYDICLLQVDLEGNVYINPTKQERPTLLRKSPNSTPADIKQFELYKGDWYLRK